MLRILIADDHEVVRRGLRDILCDAFPKLRIEEAANSTDALDKVIHKKWDLVLLDIVMPGMNVIDLLARIRKAQPNIRILVLTAISEPEYAVRTMRAGANGYITKQNASDELVEAIRHVVAGGTYLSETAAQALANNLQGHNGEKPHEKLSPRELEIFCLIANGKTVKEIGWELEVSDKTVSTYLARIKEKTGMSSHVEITRYALHAGLAE